jgi:small GTP-binding protein
MRQSDHISETMPVKIVFFGYRQSGKTKLIKRMLHPEIPQDFDPESTAGFVTEQATLKKILLEIWDFPGEPRYSKHRPAHYKNADIAIYCIDLSDWINENQIDEDIRQFREVNKNATLLLVGTKADLVPEAQNRVASIANDNFTHRFALSALDDKVLAAFLEGLTRLAKQSLLEKIKTMDRKQLVDLKIDLFDYAKDNLPKESAIYQAIDSFMETIAHLPNEKYCALGKEAFILVDALKMGNKELLPDAIEIFTTNCDTILKNDPAYLKNVALAFAAAIVVALFVAIAGFMIGFAFGLWAGPLAFFTGLATSYAAITVLSLSGAAGVISGLLTAYGLFTEKTPEIAYVNEIAEAAAAPLPEI